MIKPVEKMDLEAGGVVGVDREREEFESLFERYSQPVTSFFARRGFSPEDCRDLTQETFLGVYRGMARFRRESSVETWLFTIAANVWRNELRSRSADKREGQEISLEKQGEDYGLQLVTAGAEERDDPLAGLIEQELSSRVRRALGELPSQMRRCLVLRIDGQLKYREIAVVMRTSIETVKSQLFQARERLRDLLKHD